MSKITVGTSALSYPEKRNFAGLSFRDFEVRKVHDWYKLPSWLYFKLKKRSNWYWLNSFNDFGLNSCRLYHFFNVVSHGKKPWLTTFETYVPRWTDSDKTLIEKGLRLVAGDACRQLIALSQCTYDIQQQFTQDHFPSYWSDIRDKMQVMHPPQAMLINNYSEKKTDNNYLVFSFVGADLFRKGGKDMLAVFERLLKEKAPVKLNLISTANYGDYASQSTKADYDAAMQLIAQYPEQITHYRALPNYKVMELLVNSHAALLPTMAETYGYSVLEAQAAGCPVITTDIRALPEINNESCGWLIPVTKDHKRNARIATEAERLDFSKQVQEHLLFIIRSMLNNPELVKDKGTRALERIKTEHNPLYRSSVLESLYRQALI